MGYAGKGLNRFLVEVQAHRMDPDSVQARVFGHGELLSAQYREVPVVEAPQPEIRRLDNEKKALLRKKKALADEKEVLHKQRSFLDAFIDFADKEIPKAVKTRFPEKETVAAMLTFLADRFGHLAAGEQDVDARLEAVSDTRPAVNQIEVHPFHTNEEVRAYGAGRGIVTEAWSPLAQGEALTEPAIVEIAERVGRAPSQVVLRWHLQRGDVVFPKTMSAARMAENIHVFGFELGADDMRAIAALDRGTAGRMGPHPDEVN